MQVPTAVVKQAQFAKGVAAVEREFRRDVVRIRYQIGNDWSGDLAIYFRILLSDDASRENRLYAIAAKISDRLVEKLRVDELGLLPYFNFRSESEQAELQDEVWA